MAKEFKMISIFAILSSELAINPETKPTLIGHAEKESEVSEIMEEYDEVFGSCNVQYTTKPTPHEVYVTLRNQAFANLFGALYAPIDNLAAILKSLKR